ncbi:MAG TPA: winged helix-turn-helix domain-containing protein [Candidatus Eisenbacteria bacterium]|nr:winged helix-turn-helix domain-containing protein [Candidatus Eisenbacteria bacterium]
MPVLAGQRVRFDDFELDTRAGELSKHGVKLKLQGHPIEILGMLLERPGDLIRREEIQQRLWPSEAETFVDFEQGLNNSIRRLRQALGDEAETPRYIETLPRRGYRFVGQVSSDDSREAAEDRAPRLSAREVAVDLQGLGATPSVAVLESSNRRLLWTTLSLFGVVLLGLAAYLYYRTHRAPPLTEKDTIVVSDFKNTTGDVVFIDTLRQGLLVQLSQSAFLSILSDDKVRTTLQEMGRQPQEWLSDQLAREICLRSQSKVYVSGSISSLGSQYVLGLKAVNCKTGDVLVQEQTQVEVT